MISLLLASLLFKLQFQRAEGCEGRVRVGNAAFAALPGPVGIGGSAVVPRRTSVVAPALGARAALLLTVAAVRPASAAPVAAVPALMNAVLTVRGTRPRRLRRRRALCGDLSGGRAFED
jgi:hypothetical protein